MRLEEGGLIDRDRPVGFVFDGRAYTGFLGDTLASALLANGVRLVGRSFKYHRPRGILSAGSEEPNALMEVGIGAARSEPNTRATVQELYEGLVAESQNRFPSLRHDLLAVNDLLSPLLGAGFYYKTFMWPKGFWERVYEPVIRRAAGLGRLSGQADTARYDKAWAHCDLLVIGAGPAGLMAARTAAEAGADVILADEDSLPGGRLNAETGAVDGMPGPAWAAETATRLAAMPNVRLMRRTTVTGVYDGGTYAALERVAEHLAHPPAEAPRQIFWRIVARQAVLAAGAIERPIAFPDNDRPGVMLAGAVRAYLNRWGVAPGARVAVFTNNDDGRRTARDLVAAGVEVAALIDTRGGGAEEDVPDHSGRPGSGDGGAARAPPDHRADGRRDRDGGGRLPRDLGRLEPGGASDVPSRHAPGLAGRYRGIRAGAGGGAGADPGRCGGGRLLDRRGLRERPRRGADRARRAGAERDRPRPAGD